MHVIQGLSKAWMQTEDYTTPRPLNQFVLVCTRTAILHLLLRSYLQHCIHIIRNNTQMLQQQFKEEFFLLF
jgi:hypothetical protein